MADTRGGVEKEEESNQTAKALFFPYRARIMAEN
jgi:hypothetical protein